MELYLLRHGVAESGGAGRPDAQRRLTGEGKEKLRQVLARARSAKVAPSLILASPLVRAVETARIAAQELGYRGAIPESDALLPSSTPAAAWRELRSHGEETAILVAGHEPLLSELASFLLGTSRVVVEMKKGALARIDLEVSAGAPQGLLRWLITAKLGEGSSSSPF